MEDDELRKRFEWLDGERRKDRQTITDLVEQVNALQETVNSQKRELTNARKDLKNTSAGILKINEYEEVIAKQRVDFLKSAADFEKRLSVFEQTTDGQCRDDRDIFNKRVLELQNEIKPLHEIKKEVQSKGEDNFRLNQKIDDVARQLADLRIKDEELQRFQKITDSSSRQESKRISDLQVEMTTMRKQMDEERIATDAQKAFVQKLEGQINDLTNREKIRIQEQVAFIENQSRLVVERENQWKGWQEKIDQLNSMGDNLQRQLLNLDAVNREVKTAQGDFNTINERLERRINEITEMSRLSEERFRQEWIAFKADDQKRWTNYSLTQDESHRESDREVIKIVERILALEDSTQRLADSVQVINEETEKRIKSLLAMANEFLSSYERTVIRKG